MEKKLKIAEFAALVGVTAKTVYKMVDREEIVTVSEKVNNRLTTLVVTTDEEIEKFKNIYGKQPVNNSNCEDILTDNEEILNHNNHSQINNNSLPITEIFEKMMQMNQEYNNHIEKLNNELITTKSQILLLEDKAGREGFYLKEINELKTENEQLKTSNKRVSYTLLTVIVVLLLILVSYFTFNMATAQKKADITQEIINPE